MGHPAAFVAAAFGGMAAPLFVTISGWGLYRSASRRAEEGHTLGPMGGGLSLGWSYCASANSLSTFPSMWKGAGGSNGIRQEYSPFWLYRPRFAHYLSEPVKSEVTAC